MTNKKALLKIMLRAAATVINRVVRVRVLESGPHPHPIFWDFPPPPRTACRTVIERLAGTLSRFLSSRYLLYT